MKERKDRRDKCKCGRYFYWSSEERVVSCPHCKTGYNVDCDTTWVYWLEEQVKGQVKFRTPER